MKLNLILPTCPLNVSLTAPKKYVLERSHNVSNHTSKPAEETKTKVTFSQYGILNIKGHPHGWGRCVLWTSAAQKDKNRSIYIYIYINIYWGRFSVVCGRCLDVNAIALSSVQRADRNTSPGRCICTQRQCVYRRCLSFSWTYNPVRCIGFLHKSLVRPAVIRHHWDYSNVFWKGFRLCQSLSPQH